jgi:tetratricopeptide (TPR) repeat protein
VAQSHENPKYRESLGISLYRAGKYEGAAKQLSEAAAAYKRDAGTDSTIYPPFFLAMTKQKLGDKAEAKRIIADAEKAMDEEMKANVPWNRRAALELFRREAEAELSEPNIGTSAAAPK